MRILQLHSNFITYKPVEKEIPQAEEAEKTEIRVEEVVVLFTAVEEGDNVQMAQKAINDVRAFLGKLKVNKILIYPFAHLSGNLSKPSEAFKVIKEMEDFAKPMFSSTSMQRLKRTMNSFFACSRSTQKA